MNIRVYTPLAHLQVMKHIILCDEFNLQSVTVKMCDIVKSKYNFLAPPPSRIWLTDYFNLSHRSKSSRVNSAGGSTIFR